METRPDPAKQLSDGCLETSFNNPQQVEKYQEVINNYVSKGEILKS